MCPSPSTCVKKGGELKVLYYFTSSKIERDAYIRWLLEDSKGRVRV
jgi:hypothetical protein